MKAQAVISFQCVEERRHGDGAANHDELTFQLARRDCLGKDLGRRTRGALEDRRRRQVFFLTTAFPRLFVLLLVGGGCKLARVHPRDRVMLLRSFGRLALFAILVRHHELGDEFFHHPARHALSFFSTLSTLSHAHRGQPICRLHVHLSTATL